MQHAPPVTYPLGRSRFAGGVLLILWLSGLLAVGLWVGQTDAPGWRQALALSAVIVIGSWAGWSWFRTPTGTLTWDGNVWIWSRAGPGSTERSFLLPGGTVQACLDLQRVVLVAWRGGAGSRQRTCWLWLTCSHCPERWGDIRRAVYSRATTSAPPPSVPPLPPTAKT